MNKLPQDFMRIIRSYDSHPCADIIYGALITIYDGVKIIKTPAIIEPHGRHCAPLI